jgi:hypothetical protein
MAKSMRDGVCPNCGPAEVIESAAGEFIGEGSHEVPMCVTYDRRWVLQGRNPAYGHGPLVLYTCRSCGLTQWYARNPRSIPISDEHGTRLIRADSPDTGGDPSSPPLM